MAPQVAFKDCGQLHTRSMGSSSSSSSGGAAAQGGGSAACDALQLDLTAPGQHLLFRGFEPPSALQEALALIEHALAPDS